MPMSFKLVKTFEAFSILMIWSWKSCAFLLVRQPLLLPILLRRHCYLNQQTVSSIFAKASTADIYTKLKSSVTDDRLETPGNDVKTKYYQFRLTNNIPVTLVSDKTSKKASASLAVGAGAQDDPTNRQGLAHFTEHAVFLGSEKFPQERAYKEFLSRNGGSVSSVILKTIFLNNLIHTFHALLYLSNRFIKCWYSHGIYSI